MRYNMKTKKIVFKAVIFSVFATLFMTTCANPFLHDREENSAPGTPTGLTIITGTNNITLSWDSVSGADGYHIYRGVFLDEDFDQVGTSATTSYSIAGSSANYYYYYKVAAYNANGTGSLSEPVSSATVLVGMPTGITAVASGTSIVISWTAVTNATGYRIYRDTSSTGTFAEVGTTATTSYTNTGLSAGTTYYYKVAAYNSVKTGTQSSYYSATIAPSTPANLSVAMGSAQTSIVISWSSVTGATGYRVYRNTSSTGTFTQVGTSTTNSYTNTGVTATTTYYYKVAAYNGGGESPQSSASSGQNNGSAPLTAPANLTTTASTYNSISLSWDSVTGATGYNIYRSSSSSGAFIYIDSTNGTTYTNSGLSTGTIYFYKVAAYNGSGTGPQSSTVSQSTQYSSSYTLSISGTPRIGQQLTVSTGGTGWTDTTIVWCFASSAEGDLESDGRRHFYTITSGTSTTYTIQSTNVNVTINGVSTSVSLVGKYIRAFRRHPSGTWEQTVSGTVYRTFPSNFLGPIQP